MIVYLMRHGETDWNVEWRCQGMTDIPLNERGIAQAKEASEKMKDIPFDYIVSSPLQRAVRTAQIMAEPHELEVHIDDRLREMCFGVHEGTTPDYKMENPNRAYLFDAPEKYVPEGAGESFDDVDKRCRSFLEDLKTMPYNCVLISGHGAMCKAIQRILYGFPIEKFWETPPIPNCNAITFEL